MSEGTRIGTRIDGKYLVIEELGRGGMSMVWLARDERLGKLWAIKEIRQGLGGVRASAFRQSMIDEANLMKRLDHVAIPRVVDILDTGASVFVVMDYVEGTALGKALRQRGVPFSQDEVVGWGIQLCDVLYYLHNLEPPIVYRDMKPANVILREDGTVKLIDFGIATEGGRCVRGSADVVGTPGYAAPEQMGVPGSYNLLDGRADVYALGMTLYSLVTGDVPKRPHAEGGSKTSFAPKPIREWNRGLSEGLERVICKATNTDPMRRYANMSQMRYDLEHYEQLTDQWMESQRKKIRRFCGWVGTAALFFVLGICLLVAEGIVRRSTSGDYVERAREASWEEDAEGVSDSEQLYRQALEVDPRCLDAYFGLIDVYERDLLLSDAEDRRLRTAFERVADVATDKRYAELCFAVGTCYLSYYKIDQSGGAVGNAGLASIEAAGPWFRRVVESCEQSHERHAQTIDATDLRAAQSYLVIADFHQGVARAGREGRSSTKEYAAFWTSIEQCVAREAEADEGSKSAEGVRMRLCQVAVESVASATYLLGFARAGVTEEQVSVLIGGVRSCVADLRDFARLEECGVVYGPVLKEIGEGLEIAAGAMRSVYANPVARLERRGDGEGAHV